MMGDPRFEAVELPDLEAMLAAMVAEMDDALRNGGIVEASDKEFLHALVNEVERRRAGTERRVG